MKNKDEALTYEALTALCRKQEEYIKEVTREMGKEKLELFNDNGIKEYFNPIKPYSTSTLESIKDDLRNYEEYACADEQEEIEFINYLLRNCIIIDKNKLLEMIHRQKLLGISNEGNLTDTYKYSLDIERIIKIGKHTVPANEEDLILKELDERIYQEFIKYFEEHLGVNEDD